ncbi:mucin-2-like [Python bivittatus]|uniref:Mucin-2-like n=1 Tax=Python bivittatus TaxID=176946 RepID=A0A9F5J1W9_PYTBI|nr:mucin-2-like [Python bivittatus]
MSGSGVKCVTTPCITSCPDAKVVVHPPPLILTLPGLSLRTSPNQCLLETQTSCLTNGSEVGCNEGSTAIVTKSSGVCALSGGDTPCCTTTCPDSQVVIQPPPVCITIPGAVLTSYPNECLIKTSTPCVPSGPQPPALTRSTSVSDCSLTPRRLSRSASVPSGLDSLSRCVTRGPTTKVVIHPPPIEVTIPGPVLEIAAQECAVEVYNPCSSNNALTSSDQKAITSSDEGEVKALTTQAKSCTTVCGLMDTSSCISQGPEMKIIIQPPPIEVELPGPILEVFPEACKIETLNPSPLEPEAITGSETKALCSSKMTSTALATTSNVKRPLPNLRRAPRPWAEMYSRSMTPRTIALSQQTRLAKYRNTLHSMNFQPSF